MTGWKEFAELFLQGGAMSVVAFLVFWLTRSHLPRLQKDYHDSLAELAKAFTGQLTDQRREFLNALTDQRRHFLDELSNEREVTRQELRNLTETILRHEARGGS